jgi:hypothetical protein
MGFFEECVESFETMDPTIRKKCDDLWDSVSLNVQEQKLSSNGIFDVGRRNKILKELKQRPSFLVHVASKITHDGLLNFAEVGTAQGLQSIMFADTFAKSQVYTCDIKDDRGQKFHEYQNIKFVLGDSLVLGKELKSSSVSLDFCWVDGSHDHYAVLDDFLSLLPSTHDDTVWAFDDYDTRFGCFRDLNVILKHFREHVVLDLGETASGNPNRIVLTRGFS